MAPVAKSYVACSRGEFRLEVERFPRNIRILKISQNPKLNLAQLTPENPIGYLPLPGPAYLEKVIGLPIRLIESIKWKWLSIHKGSIPGIRECVPCCQSIHQKSTPSSSRGWCRVLIYAERNSRDVQSKLTGLSSALLRWYTHMIIFHVLT
jgi:hypothetical protein